jgi:hypothetical protein
MIERMRLGCHNNESEGLDLTLHSFNPFFISTNIPPLQEPITLPFNKKGMEGKPPESRPLTSSTFLQSSSIDSRPSRDEEETHNKKC